jgi:adenylylsulfate kinase-like enzyme
VRYAERQEGNDLILWLTGNTGAGKTTLAHKLAKGQRNTVVLDGDDLREIWPGLSLDIKDRWENCLRAARLARYLEGQGMAVIVAVIAPYVELRREIETMCGCQFVYLDGGAASSSDKPYEKPDSPVLTVSKDQ